MNKIKTIILKYEYRYKDEYIIRTIKKSDDSLKQYLLIIKKYPKVFKISKKIWDGDEKLFEKDLINNLSIKKLPKPNTWPKFDNETPFKLKWSSKFIKSPKILRIRWSGYGWEYELENIGHKYAFQKEEKLIGK
jgi:hypothetical protein